MKITILDKNNKVVCETIQSVSWSIVREMAPIYTLGNNSISTLRGKRNIAGVIYHNPEDKEIFCENNEEMKLIINYNESNVLDYYFDNVTLIESLEQNRTLFTCKYENYHLQNNNGWDFSINKNFDFQYKYGCTPHELNQKNHMVNVEYYVKWNEEKDCLCSEDCECADCQLKKIDCKKEKKCECGASKVGSDRHSDWCDLYKKAE